MMGSTEAARQAALVFAATLPAECRVPEATGLVLRISLGHGEVGPEGDGSTQPWVDLLDKAATRKSPGGGRRSTSLSVASLEPGTVVALLRHKGQAGEAVKPDEADVQDQGVIFDETSEQHDKDLSKGKGHEGAAPRRAIRTRKTGVRYSQSGWATALRPQTTDGKRNNDAAQGRFYRGEQDKDGEVTSWVNIG